MAALGHKRFAVAGHDRGGYVAFRLALDHPDAVTHLAVLDCVPILDHLERCDARFATLWWHWFFFAQAHKPERAILADPDAWYGNTAEAMGGANYADYRRAIHDPKIVHGMVEDYRAGLGIDREHDAEDRAAGRKIGCPVLALWSAQDDLGLLYGDVTAIWREWAADVTGGVIESGHHMAEEAPEALATRLLDFTTAAGRTA
jgi:haloacetate dehalogenase